MTEFEKLLFTDLLNALKGAQEALQHSRPVDATGIHAQARHERAKQLVAGMLPRIEPLVPAPPVSMAMNIDEPMSNMNGQRQRAMHNIFHRMKSGPGDAKK